MNFITRHRYSIIFGWITVVLLSTYFINKFTFQNNSSVLFIFVLLIVPVVVSIISHFNIKKNKQKYLFSKTNYYELIKLNIYKDLIKKLNEVTKVLELPNEYHIGHEQRLVLSFNDQYCELSIKNTIVSYKYYYSKTFDNISIYDKKGFEYQSTNVLFSELLNMINNLLLGKLVYQESNKIKLTYAVLKRDNLVLYEYKSNFKKKNYKITNKEEIKL